MSEVTDNGGGGGKNGADSKGEELSSYEYNDVFYNIGDTVYIESQRSDMPYYICSIMDFKKSKKDNINVDVVWYYRPCEIPTSVYQLLLQDRHYENGSSDHILENPIVKDRELFISDAVDIFPATALRGHARCLPFSDVKENILDYIAGDDNWFYILRYNPESRRMANAKGEIRIGASHQAILPPYIPLNERSKAEIAELNETCKEVLCWEPVIKQPKLTVFLRAARSITSYSGFCESQDASAQEKAIEATPDDISINYSYDILHKFNYNISEALQYLMKNPAPKKKMTPWTDDERKRFMRGLRSYGKYFHKIRKELLPERTTSDLVQYYYLWKKTSIAQNSRPHKKGCRRSHIRKTRTSKPKTTVCSEFLDLSSCSETEVLDADDSENDARYLYACRHCYTTQSPNWHHAGKNKLLLCHECRVYFKRYAHMKPLSEEEKRDPPPFIYKAAFENIEGTTNYSGRMRTRRSATPVFANGVTIKSRILQDAKLTTRKQVTTPSFANNEDSNEKAPTPLKRKVSEESEDGKQDSKKTRLIMREEENAEDADDESDGESVTTTGVIAPRESPLTPQQSDENERKTEDMNNLERNDVNTFTPISQDVPSQVNTENLSSPDQRCSSPEDVPEDLELNKKIRERFHHSVTEDGNSCSRCERIYTFKKPKKQKTNDIDASKHKEDAFEHSRRLELAKGGNVSPPMHQPAQITSHFETMRLYAQHQAMGEPRFWHAFHPDMHAHRSVSPREFVPVDQPSKHAPFLKADRGIPDHMPHPPPFSGHQNHSHHFPGRPSEHSRDYRILHGERSHVSPHGLPHGNIDGRFPHDNVAPGIMNPMERPPLDPITGLPAIQPHLHSHLHTHTHLHVHPDDIKYRGVHPESHHERLERNTPHHMVPPTPHPPCRPSSAGRDYHENINMLLQPDPHLRETISRHLPGSIRSEGNHPPISREGAVSPSFPREMASVHNDPVAYHLWVTQLARMHQRPWSSHSNSAQQAPDLSPHGLPSGPPHHSHNAHAHLRSEQEKHIHEKLMQAEREKLHEKHMRHLLHSRGEHIDPKMKNEHALLERATPFKPSDMRGHFNNNHYLEGMRRTPHEAFMLHDRSIHERMAAQERLERDRLAQLERPSHMERFERTRHDRPSIFGRYKPEMIDLSDD